MDNTLGIAHMDAVTELARRVLKEQVGLDARTRPIAERVAQKKKASNADLRVLVQVSMRQKHLRRRAAGTPLGPKLAAP